MRRDDVGAVVIVNPAPPRAAPAGALLTPNEHECAHLGGVEHAARARRRR